ncbi:bifunctional glutamate--cysteine ligase/glutathione synthetase, partial [Streptococcus suis]
TSDILDAMESVLKHFHLPDHYKGLLEAIKEQVADPSLTLSGQLLAHITDQSLEAFGQIEGQAHHDYAWHAFYALKDFENMELSTQMLMFDAIQKGVQIEILDEEDQFLRLSYKGHIELVKNGNMTSKDNYVVPL